MDLNKRTFRKVAPGEVSSRWRPWIFVRSSAGRSIIVYWRRVAAYLAVLALVGWCTAAGAVRWLLASRHPGAEVSYWNIVLPFRWDEHRRSLGRHYVRLGEQALAERRVNDAYRLLSVGVARAPEERSARRKLAELMVNVRQPDRAADLLLAGVAGAREDPDYLRLTFSLLEETGRDDAIVAAAGELLAAAPRPAAAAGSVVALFAAKARQRAGDYDGSEALANEWRLADRPEGVVLLAGLDLDRGYPELALARLRQALDAEPLRDAYSVALVRVLRALGRTAEADTAVFQRVVADPFSPGPRIDVLHAYRLRGDRGKLGAEIDRYVREFATDHRALMLLAQFAVDLPDTDLADRLLVHARERGLAPEGFRLAAIDCRLRAGRWAEAVEGIAEAAAAPGGAPAYRNLLAGFRAVAEAGRGDAAAADGELAVFSAGRPRPGDALLVARLLDQAGDPARARRVLAALPADRPNQAVAAALVGLDLELDDRVALEADLPALLRARRPPRELLQEAYLRLDDSTPARAALRREIRAAVSPSGG